ncbi:hypothetical protein [Pantoea vagans]|uniref:hypothetical protein n=1 Tax=Pantoea vagans TaxID=470934 RepID=UPI0023B02621|nr:hypothetical protein [Pantoea vagans]MDE8558849.1 hypothetical protein [Pantoea vagans]MDE8578854.1 hypothetical protein [Pantoea vagans]
MMLLEDMDWNKSSIIYNEKVKNDVHEARYWFYVECPSKKINNLDLIRFNLMDEMHKMKKDSPRRHLTHAIYVLFFNEYLKDPLNLSFEDIENARWAIKNDDYGYPEFPPNKEIMKIPSSFFKL